MDQRTNVKDRYKGDTNFFLLLYYLHQSMQNNLQAKWTMHRPVLPLVANCQTIHRSVQPTQPAVTLSRTCTSKVDIRRTFQIGISLGGQLSICSQTCTRHRKSSRTLPRFAPFSLAGCPTVTHKPLSQSGRRRQIADPPEQNEPQVVRWWTHGLVS